MDGIADVSIEWLFDESDCETCGSNWAEGAFVTFANGDVLDFTPWAGCSFGTSYERADVYKSILEHLGYTVEEV
jgi:hypothetical protein